MPRTRELDSEGGEYCPQCMKLVCSAEFYTTLLKELDAAKLQKARIQVEHALYIWDVVAPLVSPMAHGPTVAN